ncbi:MAG: right-handed parallel beta-helix repeat-containing protein [Candidatus Kerfeldbacteria bacterium]|nr:right-handed parallel beta-helix repeat-containing protein [Candidatus Kerfeldbacteria bacterium]
MKFFRHIPIVIIAAGIVLAVGFAWRSEAQSVIDLTSCQGITSSGSYRLANDVSSGGDCFYIRGNYSNITFDGNGKTITTPYKAFDVADLGGGTPSNITLTNFTTNGEIRVYGDAVNHVTIQNLTANTIGVNGSDDITISGNTVSSGGIQVNNSDNAWPPLRPIITNNTVTGQVGHDTKVLIEIAGFNAHPCARIDGTITGNTVNNYRNDPPPEATAVVRIRCATHNTIRNNTFRAFGTTLGLYLRDEADDNVFENNTFWTNDHPALWIASGNVDKTFPSRNTFYNNIFRTDNEYAFYGSAVGTGNLFSYNTFSSNAGLLGYVGGDYGNTYDHNTFYNNGNGSLQSLQGNNTEGPPADTYTNNIFSYGGSQVFGYDQWRASRYAGNYNLFFNRNGALSFGTVNGVSNTTLAQWRSATGDDANSLNTDPLMTNPGAGDFTIASTSPARGAGSSGTDIGAKPYSNSPPPPCVESWSCGAWSACTNNSQTRSCTDANDCGTTVNRPALTQSCDSTAPTVSMTAPTNGATVSGTVNVTANASDAVGVSGVQFKLDGANLGSEDAAAPYSTSWNTSGAANGSHTLTAVARDAAGNSTTATTITVIVNNVAACSENWSCTDWSSCSNNSQSRTCTDANSCGSTISRPPLTQWCTTVDLMAPVGVTNLEAR